MATAVLRSAFAAASVRVPELTTLAPGNRFLAVDARAGFGIPLLQSGACFLVIDALALARDGAPGVTCGAA